MVYVKKLSIRGPQGPQGQTGATGETGPQGPKGDTGAAGRAFVLYNGVATAGSTIANPNNVGLRGGKVDDTLVDQNGDMFYITEFTDAACKLGSKIGSLKGPQGPAGPTQAATADAIGAVKPGAGLSVAEDGTLSVTGGGQKGVPTYIVNAASDTTSVQGDAIAAPCLLVVIGTTPPQIIYSS